jgi:Tol biopolymer transport system component
LLRTDAVDLRDPIGVALVCGLACGRTQLVFAPADDDATRPFDGGKAPISGGNGGGRASGVGVGTSDAGGSGGGADRGTGGAVGSGGAAWDASARGGGGAAGADRADGAGGRHITRVSVSSAGHEGDGISTYSRISGDGSRVVFVSRADNFFPKPMPGALELAVHDRRTRMTTRVCEATGAVAIPPAFTTDGAMVGFTLADAARGVDNAVLCDWTKGEKHVLLAKGGVPGDSPQLTPDGRFVGFETSDPSSGAWHVVVRNLVTLEERTSSEARLPWGFSALSSDAHYVLLTTAKGLVRWDRLSNAELLVAQGAEGDINFPAISGDGRFVTFASTRAHVSDDTNGADDIYLYDVALQRIERISAGLDGRNSNGRSLSPCISSDGRFVVYASDAANLVRGDTNGARDIFVFDRTDRTTERVNLADDGSQGNGNCHVPSISDDGRVIAFSCEADNEVPNDTNGVIDVFVVER